MSEVDLQHIAYQQLHHRGTTELQCTLPDNMSALLRTTFEAAVCIRVCHYMDIVVCGRNS
ncbi:MAG: hypothetical protein ACKPKO_00580, partial [Candidatus Fonsibacter sp.]